MNYEELELSLDYHYWAQNRMFDALALLSAEQWTRPLESSFKSIRDTAAHNWAGERVWCSRWQGVSPNGLQSSESFPTAYSLRVASQQLEQEVRSVVRKIGPEDIDRRFEYKGFFGAEQSAVFWHMVQHVVNHASYHRGQLTTMLRQVDATPPKGMDLITFYREREAQQNTAAKGA
jgi:uncharacterized damage-inducible protein DinB